MILLTKRNESNPHGEISHEELFKLINLDKLQKEISYLKEEINKLSEKLLLTENNTQLLLNKENEIKITNISNSPNIEKDSSIIEGSIYYDVINDRYRVKSKSGWKTLKIE